jgi:hypothetical protein
MQERHDQINMKWLIFVVFYEDMLYFSIKASFGGYQIK